LGAEVAPAEPGASGTAATDRGTAATDPSQASGRAFADKLEKLEGKLEGTSPVTGAGAHPSTATATASAQAGRPTATSEIATADIAADLRAGHLPPRAAVDKVIDQVLDRVLDGQLSTDAPPGVRERVRAALQEALESDPLLAEKLQRLG
jgi:hypothetical protein